MKRLSNEENRILIYELLVKLGNCIKSKLQFIIQLRYQLGFHVIIVYDKLAIWHNLFIYFNKLEVQNQ